jgi:hypothetical protein
MFGMLTLEDKRKVLIELAESEIKARKASTEILDISGE